MDLCLLKRKKSAKVQKYGTIQFANQIYQGDCLLGRESGKISLRYDPSNIIYILAYTEEKIDAPSKFLGVLKARERKEEKLSLQSLEFEQKLARESGRSFDPSSIFEDTLDRNEFAERKLRGKRKQKRNKEHDKAGCSEGLSNVIELKRQESEPADVNFLQTPTQRPVKRLRPKRSAIVAATNWNQQLEENW